MDPDDPVDAIALAWLRERPGTTVEGIGIVTRVWHIAKLFGDDRRRVLAEAGADPATLDLLAVLRRAGPPYRLTTRELVERTMVTAGAISQRLARAERDALVARALVPGSRQVAVTLEPAGHALVERLVDRVLTREAELVSGQSAADRAELTRLLRLLFDDLGDRLGRERLRQVGADRS